MRDESGQLLPLLATALVATVAVGLLLFQVGAAATRSAQGQTAADAAALAGAKEVERQLTELVATSGDTFGPDVISRSRVVAAAADYAERNGGRLVDLELRGFDVIATVESRPLGKSAEDLDREDARARMRARANVSAAYGFGLPVGVGGALGGGGTRCIPESEIRQLEEKAGVKARSDSALRRYCGAGSGGPADVADLAEAMKIAILKAEDLIGPLIINSGFRTVAYQRDLCARVSGPCAAPGASLHNIGQAIDVGNWTALVGVAARVGLCQPLPSNDAVHFSLVGGRECAGNSGTLGPGQRFGGDLGAYVNFSVRLVKLED